MCLYYIGGSTHPYPLICQMKTGLERHREIGRHKMKDKWRDKRTKMMDKEMTE